MSVPKGLDGMLGESVIAEEVSLSQVETESVAHVGCAAALAPQNHLYRRNVPYEKQLGEEMNEGTTGDGPRKANLRPSKLGEI